MNTLIDAAALHARLDDARLLVLDCRFSLADVSAGPAAYMTGHIPGARYVNLNEQLSAPVIPGKTGRHPLPTREAFAATLRALGARDTSSIVAYDDASGAFAARLWWMVRWLGHADVAVLDGGFRAWREAGYPVSAGTVDAVPGDFSIRPPLTRTVEAQALLHETRPMLDARDRARYLGQNETIDPVAGHIPGAISAPFTENLTADQRMKPVAELEARFNRLGLSPTDDTICYCGSGVTANMNILALVHAGFKEPALFPGSWSEWITDPGRPVETDGS